MTESLNLVLLEAGDLGHQSSGVALLMTVKALAPKIPLCPVREGSAFRHPIAHIVGIRVVVGEDDLAQPVGVRSDVIIACYDACKFLDLCVKEVSGIIIDHGDTALVALPLLAPVIGIDMEFACALDVKPIVTDTEIYRGTASLVVPRSILLAYESGHSHRQSLG